MPARGAVTARPRQQIISAKAKDFTDAAKEKAGEAAEKLGKTAEELKTAVGEKMPKSREELKIDLGLGQIVQVNFAVQVALTVVSWGVLFATLHHNVGKGIGVITFPTVANVLGVVFGAFSAFTSYSYISKVKQGGDSALDGYEMQQRFFDHMKVNFYGAVSAIIGLQAEVGTMFSTALFGGAVQAAATTSEAALAQAAANTILAHLVSIIFLSYMTQKISVAYKKLVDWSEEVKASMSRLA